MRLGNVIEKNNIILKLTVEGLIQIYDVRVYYGSSGGSRKDNLT